MALSLVKHADGKHRCSWCGEHADYIAYHDDEWGMPQGDDHKLFEKMTLEGFQSGLSWLTILRKREGFRAAFKGFEIERVARFTDKDVEKLVLNADIVRHRGKITSAINNAQRCKELIKQEGSLAKFVWQFRPAAGVRPAHWSKGIAPQDIAQLAQTAESLALSKALKKRGFSFVGPTTMYAFMQSMGMVNDHLAGCHAQAVVAKAQAQFNKTLN
jgi:DNA-3-methyladenine glycosylase I